MLGEWQKLNPCRRSGVQIGPDTAFAFSQHSYGGGYKIRKICSVFYLACGAVLYGGSCSVEVQQSTLSCLIRGLHNTQFHIGRDCICVGHINDTKWEISYDNLHRLHILPQHLVYQYSSLCMHQMQWPQCSMRKDFSEYDKHSPSLHSARVKRFTAKLINSIRKIGQHQPKVK